MRNTTETPRRKCGWQPGAAVVALILMLSALGLVTALPVQAVTNATLSGKLLSNGSLGFPNSYVTVSLYRADNPNAVATTTVSDGTYSFSQLEPGAYEVLMSGSQALTQWQGGNKDRATAQSIAVAAPNESDPEPTVFDLMARVRPVFTGRASRSDSAPPNFTVRAVGLVGVSWVPVAVTSASSSTGFTVRADHEGPTRVFIHDSLVDGAYRWYYGDRFSGDNATTYTSTSGETTELGQIVYPAPASWSAQVRNAHQGVVYGRLSAWVIENGQPKPLEYSPNLGAAYVTTGANRSSVKMSVPADRLVTLRAQGVDPADNFEPRFLGNTDVAEDAQYETLGTGALKSGTIVNLAGGRSQQIQVFDRAAVPVPGVTIEARNKSGDLVSIGATDATGHLDLDHLPAPLTGEPYALKVVGDGNFYKGFRATGGGWTSDSTATTYGHVVTSNGSPYPIAVQYPAEFNLEPVTEPVLTGDPILGATVTLTPSTWNVTPDRVTYQWWLRYNRAGDGRLITEDISGGPSDMLEYRSSLADPGGSRFMIRAVATKAGYGSRVHGPIEFPVQLSRFTEVEPAALVGTAVVGNTMTIRPPVYTVLSEWYDVEFGWERQSPNGLTVPLATSTGTALPPTTRAYRLAPADVGKRIVVTPAATTNSASGLLGTYTSQTNTPVTSAVIRARSVLTSSLTSKTVQVRKRVWRNGRYVYVYVTVRTVRVVVKVTTAGVSKPGGRVSVTHAGRTIGSFVPTSGVAWTKTISVPTKGIKTFGIKYTGATLATPVSKAVTVTVR